MPRRFWWLKSLWAPLDSNEGLAEGAASGAAKFPPAVNEVIRLQPSNFKAIHRRMAALDAIILSLRSALFEEL